MRQYQVLNEITVERAALIHNYNYFAELNPGVEIAPVLKANAYGHGLELVARVVDEIEGVPFICVDSLYEAYELHKKGITTPILIMGYTNPENYNVWKKLPFSFTVFDTETLRALSKYQPGARIHIKLDTGMRRLGLQKTDLSNFLTVLSKCSNLKVEGIFSHFSQADNPARIDFTNQQIARFKEMVTVFEEAGYSFNWKHISATAGATNIRDPYFNLVRLGLGFYGYSPFGESSDLRPALTLTTRIAQIKEIQAGDQVGYSGTYIAKRKETIAILPLGYNEGLSRNLSNRGIFFLKNGDACKIVGNVSMDMTMVKLPRGSQAKVGDELTLESVYNIARSIDTIPYTVLTGLHSSIRRRLV